MRAAVLRGNAEIVVEEQEECDPGEDECLIEIAAAGVCSSDIARAHFNGAYFYPLVMGHELAGTVIGVGDGVEGFCAGDRVTIFPLLPCFSCSACVSGFYAQCQDYRYYGSRNKGGFSERLCVKAWNLLNVPDGVALADAALTEPTAVVVHAIERLMGATAASCGDELVIIGGGFLGLLAVNILRLVRPDMRVTVIDGNFYKLEMAEAFGATTLHLRSGSDWEEAMPRLTARFPWVLEASGTPGGFRSAVALAACAGRVCWMGNISGDLVIPQREVSNILRRELTVVGTWNSSYQGAAPSDWTASLQLMSRGLRPSRLVSHRIALEELAPTLVALADREQRHQGRFFKVMVDYKTGKE